MFALTPNTTLVIRHAFHLNVNILIIYIVILPVGLSINIQADVLAPQPSNQSNTNIVVW